MIALDTNMLVRFFARDDEAQFRKVLGLLDQENATFFVCDLVLVETDWVLRSLYEWTAAEVANAFSRLTAIHNLGFEDEERVRASLDAVRNGADLADELIVRTSIGNGASTIATFDKSMIRRHKGFAASP